MLSADIILPLLSFVILTSYHVQLLCSKSLPCNRRTTREQLIRVRAAWVRWAINKERGAITTIPLNTLRNNLKVTSQLGSAAMLICAATVGYACNIKVT